MTKPIPYARPHGEPVFYTRRLHAGSDSDKSTRVRLVFEDAEATLRDVLPEGRRKRLALNFLETSSMYAHKAAVEETTSPSGFEHMMKR